jgi:hypothetical protein
VLDVLQHLATPACASYPTGSVPVHFNAAVYLLKEETKPGFFFLMINPFVAKLRRSFTHESQSVSSYENTPVADCHGTSRCVVQDYS